MNYLKHYAAVAAVLCMCASANAGMFGGKWGGGGCGASKSDCCAPSCAPSSCKPVIVRPCAPNVYQYQRKCSTIKPPNCDGCCPDAGCAPCGFGNGGGCAVTDCCAAPCGDACGATGACAAPAACCPGNNACAAPGDPAGCCPGNNACAAPCVADPGCAAPAGYGCGNACAAPAGNGCDGNACCPSNCCPAIDPCELAELIYTSMTACYAKDRRKAIHKLGGKYDCVCNPEIMSAFIYALNDADEDVRKEAADEIGDQLRKNPCCCCPKVTSALTCALGDCDRGVRRQAEQALEECGYDIVDGCCDDVCDSCVACSSTGCAPVGAQWGTPVGTPSSMPMNAPVEPSAPAVAPQAAPAPTPAPPAEPRAYFPRRLPNSTTSRPVPQRRGLSNLFGLIN